MLLDVQSRYNAAVAVVDLVEAASFDNRYFKFAFERELPCDCQTCSAAANDAPTKYVSARSAKIFW